MQKAAYEMLRSLVGSEMCIRDSQRIAEALLDDQDQYFGELLAAPWVSQPFGEFRVPGRLSSTLKCWGGSSDDESYRFEHVRQQCSSQDSIFIEDSFETGNLQYAFNFFSSEELNRVQFYGLLAAHYQHDQAFNANDKEQVAPMVAKVQANPEGRNKPKTWLADTGYYSEKNVAACVAADIEPPIALKRGEHHQGCRERFTEPAPLADDASPVETMKDKRKARAGRAVYALRKQTVEPVFGIIKRVMGWSQMSMRGLAKARGEWSLVTMAWNIKRLHVLRAA